MFRKADGPLNIVKGLTQIWVRLKRSTDVSKTLDPSQTLLSQNDTGLKCVNQEGLELEVTTLRSGSSFFPFWTHR